MANRLSNGDFEADVSGWDLWIGDETVTRDTSAPIAGTGSLRCQFGEDTEAGVYSRLPGENYRIPVTAGESLPVSFKVKGDCDLTVGLDWQEAGPADTILFADTVTGTPATVSETVTVPEGVTHAVLFFFTDSAPDGEFTIDDVFVGTEDAAQPIPAPAVTAALAARARRGWGRGGRRG